MYAIAATGWLILDKPPTKCRMPTRKGTACTRDTTGLLFGCQDHTWEKFFAWFGWHRRDPTVRPPSQSRQEIEPEQPVDIVENRQKSRDTILFKLTFAASCAAIISMVTDLIGLFG
ncbi:MAG: hypothetical protein ACJ72N_01765 [Labedaea sp.]